MLEVLKTIGAWISPVIVISGVFAIGSWTRNVENHLKTLCQTASKAKATSESVDSRVVALESYGVRGECLKEFRDINTRLANIEGKMDMILARGNNR